MIAAAWVQAVAAVLLLVVTSVYVWLTYVLIRGSIQPAVSVLSADVLREGEKQFPGMRLGNHGLGPARNIHITAKWKGMDMGADVPHNRSVELSGESRWALPPGQEMVCYFFGEERPPFPPSHVGSTRVEWLKTESFPGTWLVWDDEPVDVEVRYLDVHGRSYRSAG